ncbi:MAG: penicillin-binding transpeptidase domain-containing protein [Gemmatimonadetes bacterium]|nr:penicillin-binding transpeptidase domain-containing protein [Gemmatimonadota bacterium]
MGPRVQHTGINRLRLVVVVGAIAWLGLSVRLVQIQIFRHEAYSAEAREQYQRRVELKASRGRIVDRRGNNLAVDIPAMSFYAHPDQIEDPKRVAAYFASLSGKRAEFIERQLRGDKPFVYLVRQVVDADVGAVSYAGVFQEPETRRHYPLGPLAGQLIGHTNIDNSGREGIERAFDDILREKNGSILGYVDARGKQLPGRQQRREEPEHGRDLVLTLDAVYQGILEEELQRAIDGSKAQGALGVIIAPRSGEVLAVANLPLFDPNRASHSSPELRRNRAITDVYEPGSTFKVITAAAVLEDGLTSLQDRIFCGWGTFRLANGDTIRDIQPHGDLLFTQVLEKSSNIGTIKLAQRLSRHRFYEHIRNFGFAIRTGIDLPAETSGLLQEVNQWSRRSLPTIAIGQEIGVTALQLAMAYGAIANGGVLMAPRIVAGTIGSNGQLEARGGPQPIRRVLSRQTAMTLSEGLTRVVENGTGQKAHIKGVAVAGKTGTAQRALADGSGYDPNASIASFVGFLPADNPQYVCVIMVENPRVNGWGGYVAAPAFRRVMKRIISLPGGLLVEPAAKRPQKEERTVPDLRGMPQAVARFQAQMRGLPVVFSGSGTVVLSQSPLPGRAGHVERINCTLGDGATRSPWKMQQASLVGNIPAQDPRGT